MDKKEINILYQSSDFYAPYTGVSITSLFENNKHVEEINLYLLDDGISEENKKKLKKVAADYKRNITFLNTDAIRTKLESMHIAAWKGSYTTYFRLFAPGVIQQKIDRLLYIDSDTVINGRIDELYELDFNGNVCAMVQEAMSAECVSFIGIKEHEKYYNAGVILFNAKQWQDEKCENRILAYIKKSKGKYAYADQDIINATCSGKVKRLDPKYNFNINFLSYGIDGCFSMWNLNNSKTYYARNEVLKAQNNVVIYHCFFSIFGRPWEENNKCPVADLWNYYENLSPWRYHPKIKSKITLMTRLQLIAWTKLPHRFFFPVYRAFWKEKHFIIGRKIIIERFLSSVAIN